MLRLTGKVTRESDSLVQARIRLPDGGEWHIQLPKRISNTPITLGTNVAVEIAEAVDDHEGTE